MKKILIIFSLLLVGGATFGYKYIGAFLNGRVSTCNNKSEMYVLNASKSVEQIADDLIQKKIIDDKSAFLNLASFKGLSNERLATGMYRIEQGTSYRQLLNGFSLMSNGNGNAEVEVKVTFNNCSTIKEMCEKVASCLMLDADKLEKYILNGATLEKYGFVPETVPALFLPNTYSMYYDTNEEQFLDRMAKEYKNFWTPERREKLKAIGLKESSEAVTLASVVYAEQSKNGSEWPIIAGLYLNRLNTGMKLQSDPTFKFCWGDQLKGVQRLTYEHRSKDCPYNTYLYAGLPPGPISLPPTAVVDAVLNRDKNDYLYMCAQPNYDGLHNFAKDYGTHEKFANEFQRWLANELAN